MNAGVGAVAVHHVVVGQAIPRLAREPRDGVVEVLFRVGDLIGAAAALRHIAVAHRGVVDDFPAGHGLDAEVVEVGEHLHGVGELVVVVLVALAAVEVVVHCVLAAVLGASSRVVLVERNASVAVVGVEGVAAIARVDAPLGRVVRVAGEALAGQHAGELGDVVVGVGRLG